MAVCAYRWSGGADVSTLEAPPGHYAGLPKALQQGMFLRPYELLSHGRYSGWQRPYEGWTQDSLRYSHSGVNLGY